MRLLLDTHTLLWAITGERLSKTAATAILEPANQLYFSVASYWELCIKMRLGKMDLSADWQSDVDQISSLNGISWLPIGKAHCDALLDMPWHHRDPFDRLLVAQAQVEDLTLLSADQQLSAYEVIVMW